MMNENGWIDLCGVAELSTQQGVYIERGNRTLAVWLMRDGDVEMTADAVRVMDDHCPHAGGSLSAGHLRDGCVVCPWHGWEFDFNSGACPDNEAFRVKVYPVRVEGGRVMAKVEA